jgi:hypothetical protein
MTTKKDLSASGHPKGGRPKGSVSKASARQQKLKSALLRYIEPHVVEAIDVIAEIMRDKEAAANTRLQAAKYFPDKTAELVNETLKVEKESQTRADEDEPEQSTGAVLRLTVDNSSKK